MSTVQPSIGRNPRGQGELLRERLVDAALALIDEQGDTAGLSIRAVTKRAGVSPTAFYLHFASREELIFACRERTFTEFRDELRAAAGGEADPWQRLLRAGLTYIAFARERPARYELIFGSSTRDPEATGMEPKPEAGSDAFEDLVGLVLANLPEGDPRRDEADLIAKGIWSNMHGFVTLCHSRPGMEWPDDEQFAERLARAWLAPTGGRD